MHLLWDTFAHEMVCVGNGDLFFDYRVFPDLNQFQSFWQTFI